MSPKSKGFSTSPQAQRSRLLTYLKAKRSITTQEAREKLDILAPAARIFELRHDQGYNITMLWDIVDTGKAKHRIGRYILKRGKYNSKGAYK